MDKILLMDDDVDLLIVIKILLERSGFEVHACSNPTEIMLRIESFIPDLIILDVNMPHGDGRLICKDIKKNISVLSIPIILLSADENAVNDLLECEADAFIVKPFNIIHFIDTVKRLLKIISFPAHIEPS